VKFSLAYFPRFDPSMSVLLVSWLFWKHLS